MTTSDAVAACPRAGGTRAAASRLAGPSQLGSETVHRADNTTGLSDVEQEVEQKRGFLERVSAWVMTSPSMSGRSSQAAACARRHITAPA